ncbi:glycoside hydrolase family 12 protein [Pholiota conissans]|uniref:Glycoside hydrolase family 12 protein n=1 Tax=Pholiota conissans TaxID=109636 RepID=A0A9P5Z5I4_9AGAR|nr:glycoside hydrolase family 12 protein [Pholiota conissans]
MFSPAKILALVTLIPFVLAAPAAEPRATIDTTSHCGQWDTVTAGPYSLLLDQWGASGASSGSDCAQLTSLSGTTIAWKNTWNWVGGNGVKSFTNIQLNSGLNKQLSAIKSIPATWKWSQSSSGTVVADVAYDLFTSTTSGGSNVNEIMIWLANYNAGPISAAYNSDGTPKPVASNISLAGHTWNLYSGSNGSNNVFSFLPTSGTITSFSGDINTFLQYLTAHQGVSTSQFLKTAQGGTEATSGSATLTTSVSTTIFEAQSIFI